MSDSNEDWKTTPVSTHVLVLANGNNLRIDLFYNQSQIVHCDGNEFKHTTDLNELCSIFEHTTLMPDHYLILKLQVGEFDCEIPNWRSGSACRFRFGPTLAHAAGENRVEGSGSCALLDASSPQSVTNVRIEVARKVVSSDRRASLQVAIDFNKFMNSSSTRGFLVEDKNNVMTRLQAPVEILSLNSLYFCTLFHCRGFIETNQHFIEIKNIKRELLFTIIQMVMTTRLMIRFNLENSVALLHALDRFGLIRQLKKGKSLVRKELSHTNVCQRPFSTIIELSEILEDQQILVNYLDRFPLAECLTSLVEKNVDLMTQGATLLLTQRLAVLSKTCYNREKLRIVFNEGEVVCAQFGSPFNSFDLAGLVRSGSLRVVANSRVIIDNQQGVCIKIDRRLDYASTPPVISPPFFASKPVLLQGSQGNRKRLRFSDKLKKDYSVLGVVISGQELFPNLTVARSISIAN